jgi:predicted metal-dependent peptidase
LKVIHKTLKEIQDYGNLPAHLKNEIDALRKVEKKVNWKRQLRIFVNTILTVATRLSQKKVNRRFSAIKDYVLPGFKKTRKPSLLIARDTSGSVFDEKTQEEFQNEIASIAKVADVFVVDCDTQIHQAYKIKNKKDFRDYKGGGGTSFVPVFDYAKQHNFDGIIYLTDTYGTFPEYNVKKFKTKTIWVTFRQRIVQIPFGKHLNIE